MSEQARRGSLWLKEGEGTIAIHQSGCWTCEEKVGVRRGTQTKVKIRLE